MIGISDVEELVIRFEKTTSVTNGMSYIVSRGKQRSRISVKSERLLHCN